MVKELLCRLSDSELIEKHHQWVKLEQEHDELKRQAAEEAKQWKNRVSKARIVADAMRSILRHGEEVRDVEIAEHIEGLEIVTIRCDTNEVIDRRHMTHADRQESLLK